jgi:hypothetical protein
MKNILTYPASAWIILVEYTYLHFKTDEKTDTNRPRGTFIHYRSDTNERPN